tara:strand:+ start:3393 stop:4376 length:984 start_codon:yes stop_codon:yes gene_type:complete
MKFIFLLFLIIFLIIFINDKRKIEYFFNNNLKTDIIWRQNWTNFEEITHNIDILNKSNKKILFISNSYNNMKDILQIKKDFKLIIDLPHDFCFPYDKRNVKLNSNLFDKIHNMKNLKSIWSVNYNYKNNYYPKINHIPLGIDFHTITQGKIKKWDKDKKNPFIQQKELIEIYNNSKNISNRVTKCFLCCPNNNSKKLKKLKYINLDRNDIKTRLKNNKNVKICNKFYKRLDFWNEIIKYKFIIAPAGNGMDTHRLWEALFLGCIVICQNTGLDKFMNEFPVVILKDFNQITEENLNKWFKKYEKMCNDPIVREKYYQKYWYEKILNS